MRRHTRALSRKQYFDVSTFMFQHAHRTHIRSDCIDLFRWLRLSFSMSCIEMMTVLGHYPKKKHIMETCLLGACLFACFYSSDLSQFTHKSRKIIWKSVKKKAKTRTHLPSSERKKQRPTGKQISRSQREQTNK